MSNISLTIPSDDKKALVAGATMLLTLAGKIPEMELEDAAFATMQSSSEELGEQLAAIANNAEPTSDSTTVAHSNNEWPKPETFEPIAPPPPPAATDGEPGDAPTTEDEESALTGLELDANGLPWNARIHAGSKAKLQDGTWRKKRGVDEEDYNRVVEELKQLMAAPVMTPEPVGDDTAAPQEQPQEQPNVAIALPPPPPLPGVVTTEREPVPDTFPAFLKAVTMKVQAKELTIEQVNSALQPHGVANLQLLGGRPDLIPQVWADLVAPK